MLILVPSTHQIIEYKDITKKETITYKFRLSVM
mgnify:FL=1